MLVVQAFRSIFNMRSRIIVVVVRCLLGMQNAMIDTCSYLFNGKRTQHSHALPYDGKYQEQATQSTIHGINNDLS